MGHNHSTTKNYRPTMTKLHNLFALSVWQISWVLSHRQEVSTFTPISPLSGAFPLGYLHTSDPQIQLTDLWERSKLQWFFAMLGTKLSRTVLGARIVGFQYGSETWGGPCPVPIGILLSVIVVANQVRVDIELYCARAIAVFRRISRSQWCRHGPIVG